MRWSIAPSCDCFPLLFLALWSKTQARVIPSWLCFLLADHSSRLSFPSLAPRTRGTWVACTSASCAQASGSQTSHGPTVPVIKSDFPGSVPGGMPTAAGRLLHPPAIPPHSQSSAPPGLATGATGAPPPPPPPPTSQLAVQHQEFDHAISYVTNIKQRFAKEPETYKAFLDILHTYQRDQNKPKEQQKGIHEVLDQVSSLFADHPDLLKEFTYFLPDAVQAQAKERLDRAARESMERQAHRARGMRMMRAAPKPMGVGPAFPGAATASVVDVDPRQDSRGARGRPDVEPHRFEGGKDSDRKRGNRTPVSDSRRAKKVRRALAGS